MAYIDQRTGRNQRVVAMTVVAVLQGAAIVALINGLAVRFIKNPPIPNPQASDIPITMPIPIPPPPPDRKPPVDQHRIVDPLPVPPLGGPVARDPLLPVPTPPEPLPTYVPEPPLPPQPVPTITPRLAKARNAPGSWATANDYPSRDLREGNQGVTRFSLAIGTDGRVQGCTVTASSGFPGLDKATCDNVSRRARFEPATDSSGNRVPGSYTGSIRWQIPE
jgi:periplasmic protein TonB